jgi:low temperature requirement protein LtrA
MASDPRRLLRAKDGNGARAAFVELFCELLLVIAITQLSHLLREGAARS